MSRIFFNNYRSPVNISLLSIGVITLVVFFATGDQTWIHRWSQIVSQAAIFLFIGRPFFRKNYVAFNGRGGYLKINGAWVNFNIGDNEGKVDFNDECVELTTRNGKQRKVWTKDLAQEDRDRLNELFGSPSNGTASEALG